MTSAAFVDEFFTADGGYVLMRPRALNDVDRPVFACTAGDADLGVQLELHEAIALARWLLLQVASVDEHEVVRRLTDAMSRRVIGDH